MTEQIEIRVAGILVHHGKILLAEHEKAGQSYWVIPGGRVKCGETLKEALLREIKEETGLEVKPGRRIFVNDFIQEKRQVLNIYFEVVPREGLAKWQKKRDGRLRRTEFFSPEELGEITLKPQIKPEILQILAGKWPQEIYLGER
jgi:ADP-ribose pyrophosphatase YjhB (NUDIX family)